MTFQESPHRCQGLADPQALYSAGQMGADHEREKTPKPGSRKLNKPLCFVMNNLVIVGLWKRRDTSTVAPITNYPNYLRDSINHKSVIAHVSFHTEMKE